MALDYELRSEFKDIPLDQLLDNSVASFQGVGDTAQSLLSTYFGIVTIAQLANMPHFVQALAVQKMALESEKVANTPVSTLMATRALEFNVRDDERHLTVKQLLDAPMHTLEGLAPAEDLALYDAFRVTSLRQLAHNRIMIEARIIQYLARHGAEAANVSGSTDEIVAMLAGDLPPGNGKPRSHAEQPATPDEAEGELAEHVRGRLDALRSRAKQRVQNMPVREGAASDDDRLSAIRATRERAAEQRAGRGDAPSSRAGGRGDAVAAARSGAAAAVLAARETRGSSRAAEISSTAATRESVRRSVTSTTRGGAAASAARTSSPAAGARPSVREVKEQAKREEEQAAADKAAAAAEKKAARRAPPPPAIQPWMIAAAVLLAVGIAGVVWFMRSGQEPPEQAAQTSTETPSVASGDQAAPATTDGAPGSRATADGSPAAPATTSGVPGSMAGATGSGAPSSMAGATGSGAASTMTGSPVSGKRYTVKRGNSLWRISRKHYSDPLQWLSIFDANRTEIDDPDLIYPGQRFLIPKK